VVVVVHQLPLRNSRKPLNLRHLRLSLQEHLGNPAGAIPLAAATSLLTTKTTEELRKEKAARLHTQLSEWVMGGGSNTGEGGEGGG
jgi:hypothetical protein